MLWSMTFKFFTCCIPETRICNTRSPSYFDHLSVKVTTHYSRDYPQSSPRYLSVLPVGRVMTRKSLPKIPLHWRWTSFYAWLSLWLPADSNTGPSSQLSTPTGIVNCVIPAKDPITLSIFISTSFMVTIVIWGMNVCIIHSQMF